MALEGEEETVAPGDRSDHTGGMEVAGKVDRTSVRTADEAGMHEVRWEGRAGPGLVRGGSWASYELGGPHSG